MKRSTYLFPAVLITSVLFFTTCKKKAAESTTDENGQSVSDTRGVVGENDAATSDVNDQISSQSKMLGKGVDASAMSGGTGTICGLSVDTTGISTGSVTFNYDGTTCNNRTRTGKIKVSILDYSKGKRWKDVGTTVRVEYVNYKVVRASDGTSILLNGVQHMENVSGGHWWEVYGLIPTKTSIIHSVITVSTITASFEDNSSATFNINRKVTYSYPNKIVTVTAEGTGTYNGKSQLENYGTTRKGETFYSQVSTPIIWNVTCGAGAPIQGVLNLSIDGRIESGSVTFGVDTGGNPVTVAANSCPYGMKFTWTDKNNKNWNKVIGYK